MKFLLLTLKLHYLNFLKISLRAPETWAHHYRFGVGFGIDVSARLHDDLNN